MKLTIEVAGERRAIETQLRGNALTAEVDGRRYELAVEFIQSGVYLLTLNNQVYECRIDSVQVRRGTIDVLIGNRTHAVRVFDPKRLRGSSSAAEASDGRVSLRAAMPGKVVRVLVEPGAEVAAGQGLVVVEAMKMQNEMKSPKSGRVIEIHHAAGDTVSAGDALVTVE